MAFEWLNDSIANVQDFFVSNRLPITIETFPPVENLTIDVWERLLGVPFSPSHRAFFQVTNGLDIDYCYVAEDLPGAFSSGGDQIWVTPIEQIIRLTRCQQQWRDAAIAGDNTPEELWNNLVICSRLGNGYYIVLDPHNRSDGGEYRVCNADNDAWPGTWRRDLVIANSFEEWLKFIFDAMVLRKETPNYWDCRPFVPCVSPTPLFPPGAERYDWHLVDAMGNPLQ